MTALRKIFIIEDHDWVREALTQLLDLQPTLMVCGSVATAADALEALPGSADVVLVDIGLADSSGLELLPIIKDRWPHLRTIVLSHQPASLLRKPAMHAGCYAYVEKGNAAELLAAIDGQMEFGETLEEADA
jgi:DNA-binding NarL/FixJ family response regulator